jgi:Domain of unknown function (DUF1816)
MKLAIDLPTIWTDVLDFVGQAWWIEIFTAQPKCTYYFGPFINSKEAETAIDGYVEDLANESAQGIQAQVKRCKPELLTIESDPDRDDRRSQELGLRN